MTIETIKAEETYALREALLRPKQKPADCQYPGDFTSTTIHLGIRENQTLVCVASLYLENHTDFSEAHQYRCRGMATHPEVRDKKYGTKLIQEAEKILQQRGATIIWGYCREDAFEFFQKLGYQFHGPYFDVSGVGRHKVMFKRLTH